MKIKTYLSDKGSLIILDILTYFIILAILLLSKVNNNLVLFISLIYFIPVIVYLLMDYLMRKKYYEEVFSLIDKMDQKYLISEVMKDADFLDAQLIKNIIYQIDKNYLEHIASFKKINMDYKDYIETWCHEIKTPIATSKLIIENNQNKVTKSILEEFDRIEYLTEQILFYARMDTLENDYIINAINLKKIINNVIKKNKKDILNKKIKITIDINDIMVDSDPKWLEFIINQIVSNSVKYIKQNPQIVFSVTDNPNNVILCIKDNGIGISKSDINRIFDKGFTGETGRKYRASTGMGLYLAKTLCTKLNHNLTITSEVNVGTSAYIVIPKNAVLTILK